MIFGRHANYKYGNYYFRCRRYFVYAVGRYETAVKEYSKNQLENDIMNRLNQFKRIYSSIYKCVGEIRQKSTIK